MKKEGSSTNHIDKTRRLRTIGQAVLACALSALLVLSSLAGCTPKSADGADEAAHYTPGTYIGIGPGNGGDISVEVTFSESEITDIKLISQTETKTIAAEALETLPESIIEYQSLGVDTVSGATVSSLGLIAAVANAVDQAGGDSSKLRRVPAQKPVYQTVEKSADVVVVGGGGAGMTTAIRLQELGKSVILVEKTSRLGGSLSVSGGNQVVSGSRLQAEEGVTDDSPDSMVADFMKNGSNLNVSSLINLYAQNIGTTTDWINEYVGIQYDLEGGLHKLGEYSYNRELAYEGGGEGAAETFREAIARSGAEVLLNTTAEELKVQDGKVVGLIATNSNGTTYQISSDSVVLATGGYGNSNEWLSSELKEKLYYGLQSSTGDGLTMATTEGIDAATLLLDRAKIYPNGVEVSHGRAKSTIDSNILVWPMSTILVNTEGKRVVNEKASNHDILEAELAQKDPMLYLLMDEENFAVWRTKLKDTGFNEKAVEGYLESNGATTPIFAHGETLEELAEVVGMDPTTLSKTVETYNSSVENGEDLEFGRTGEYLTMKIGAGPYYLVEQKPRYATTMGGLVVNESLQVMNTHEEAITGLYAAGEVVGGVMGSDSPSGANNGWALTSGKLAAEAIAAKQ